jgi:hypothetical protein
LLPGREKEEFQYDAGGRGKQDQQSQRSLMAPCIHLIYFSNSANHIGKALLFYRVYLATKKRSCDHPRIWACAVEFWE